MKNFTFSYIGGTNISAKIKKGENYGVATYVVYLAPASLSGYNTCAMATKECIAGCLNTSGRVKMDKKDVIVNARIARTVAFYEQRELFMAQIVKEITAAKKSAEANGMKFAVRLNGTSDLSPEIFKHNGQNLLEIFPDVQFYDYTKIPNRLRLLAKYPNYHLTFSFTGYNWSDCAIAIENGVNVAAIFDTKKGKVLPATMNNVPVLDGDLSDYRVDDSKGQIVGLRWKEIKNRENGKMIKESPFVVKTNGLSDLTVVDAIKETCAK